jgi:hypothetical protein
MENLSTEVGESWCEWKGRGRYYSIFAAIKDYIAFYAGRVDACFVDEERVTPQPGGFYGGWITSDIVGPFKGGPGTMGW